MGEQTLSPNRSTPTRPMACLRRLVAGAWALAFLFSGKGASASPQDLFGFGPQASAMGGTGAAMGRGFEAVHANPALLAASHRQSLALGFQAAHFSLHANGPNAPGRMYAEGMQGAIIGGTIPIPFGGILERRVTLGTGFFTPADIVVRGTLLHPEKPHFGVLADRAQSVALQAGIGVDVGYGLRVGAGFSALAGIVGSVHVGTQANGQVGTIIEDQLVTTYAPVLGAAYELGQGFHIGATYRGTLEGRLDVVIHVNDLGSLVVPPLNIAGIAQYDPAQLQAEIGREIGDFRYAAGFTFKRWSAYPGPLEPTVRCKDDEPDCAALVPPPVGYHDTWVPRAGVDWQLRATRHVTLHFRGGAFYEPSPVPEQREESNDLDNDRLAMTLGYGLELSDPLPELTLDFAFQRHFLLSRVHVKNENVTDDNPGSKSLRAGGAVTFAALVLGGRF